MNNLDEAVYEHAVAVGAGIFNRKAEVSVQLDKGVSVTAPGEGEAQLYRCRQSVGKGYSFY